MRAKRQTLLYAALLLLFVLHNDLWWWNDPQRVLGLPIGLTFHIGLCLASALVMGLLSRYAWPVGLDGDDAGEADG